VGTVSVVIAGVALGVSVIVFLDNRAREARAARLARKPALVFTWDQSQEVWLLTNIGGGPALDVVIMQRIKGRWVHPLRMPELAADGAHSVPKLWYGRWHHDPGLGARYRSITGEEYATKTGGDYSEIAETWGELGRVDSRVEPHWHYRG
jgi:hypothetical protein